MMSGSRADSDMDEIYTFLSQQGLTEEEIVKMKNEKINRHCIAVLDDEILARYIPSLGDRVAVRELCNEMEPTREVSAVDQHTTSKKGKRKQELFQRIRRKMKMATSGLSDSDDDQPKTVKSYSRKVSLKGNTNAAKKTRTIHLGWIHEGKQVRSRKGGGSRNVKVNKDMDSEGLLEFAKNIFFPGGISKIGSEADMHFSIVDYQENELSEGATVGEICEEVKIGSIRFYLFTTQRDPNEESGHSSQNKTAVVPPSNASTSNSQTSASSIIAVAATAAGLLSPDKEVAFGPFSETGESLYVPNVESAPHQGSLTSSLLPSTLEISLASPNPCAVGTNEAGQSFVPTCISPLPPLVPLSVPSIPTLSTINTSHLSLQCFTYPSSRKTKSCGEAEVSKSSNLHPSEPPIPHFASQSNSSAPMSGQLPKSSPPSSPLSTGSYDTMVDSPRSPTPPPEGIDLMSNMIKVHRANILQDMLTPFKNPDIVTCSIKFCFIGEDGADVSGISREAYSAFWDYFLNYRAEGEHERVPALNPNFGLIEWQAVGRILFKGFKDTKYFPTKLSMAFIVALIHGENAVSSEVLMDSFLNFVSDCERHVIKIALDGKLSEYEQDELMELLSRMGCMKVPTEENIKPLLIQIAHKELVQEPNYVLDAMAEAIRDRFALILPDIASIREVYEKSKLSVRGILRLLKATPKNSKEEKCFGYLKQFIRGLDIRGLSKLLRFMTGSDIITVDHINIEFTPLCGLQRRPIAHTCDPMLELPSTYSSYPEFRGEFFSLLQGEECFLFNTK